MKEIIRTDIGRCASLNIEDSIIKDSRVKDTATVNVKKRLEYFFEYVSWRPELY